MSEIDFSKSHFGFSLVFSQFSVPYGCVVEHNTSVVLGHSEITIFREREDAFLYPSVYSVMVIYGMTVTKQYVVEFPGLPYFWGYFIELCFFSIFNFS